MDLERKTQVPCTALDWCARLFHFECAIWGRDNLFFSECLIHFSLLSCQRSLFNLQLLAFLWQQHTSVCHFQFRSCRYWNIAQLAAWNTSSVMLVCEMPQQTWSSQSATRISFMTMPVQAKWLLRTTLKAFSKSADVCPWISAFNTFHGSRLNDYSKHHYHHHCKGYCDNLYLSQAAWKSACTSCSQPVW